ncbi:MAG: hypothetical protein AB1745_18515, partial [Pseudomonadota bacterium]
SPPVRRTIQANSRKAPAVKGPTSSEHEFPAKSGIIPDVSHGGRKPPTLNREQFPDATRLFAELRKGPSCNPWLDIAIRSRVIHP